MNRKVACCVVGFMLLMSTGCGSEGVENADSTPSSNITDPGAAEATTKSDASTTPDPSLPANDPVEQVADSAIGTDQPQRISLLIAAELGNVEAMRMAIEQGERIDQGDDKFNRTPLMYAIQVRCMPCIELMVESGANLEIRNTAQATALMWAASQGTTQAVKYLLEKGADPHASTPSGRDSLYLANARESDPDMAMIIVLLETAMKTP